MGVGPIPATRVLMFAQMMGISEPEEFLAIIHAMDSAYLDEYNQKQQKENPKK